MEQQLQVSVLGLFETTKEDRQIFIEEVLHQIEEGEVDVLKTHLQIKHAENLLKNFTDKKTNPNAASRYSKSLLEAAEKMGKKFGYQNAEFQIKETGVVYDYNVCNDPIISELLQQQSDIDAKVKERQKFLQTVPEKGFLITIEDTGETLTVYRPSKSSTTSVAVTLK